MNSSEASKVLASTQLFGRLDQAVLDELATCVVPRRYRRRQLIFQRGDPGDRLFVIADGTVKVYLDSEEGGDLVLATLHSPDTFGELALLDGGPRSATAEALTDVSALLIARHTLYDFMKRQPDVLEEIHRSLGALLRRSLEQASDLVFLDLPGRVAKLLLALAHDQGLEEAEAVIDLDVTQGDLASMVGGSRPTVNQILRTFERRGYVSLSGRTIVLHEPSALRRRAGL